MEREKLVFSEEEARNIAYEDTSEFDGILDDIEDTSRWTENHRIVVQRLSDGKYFESYYSQGLTESQDQRAYEYDEPIFIEVFETVVKVTQYK
jgi:hypothetical protein